MALGMVWLCVLTSCAFALYLLRENKLRDAGKRDHRYQEPEEERNNMGDDCKFFCGPPLFCFACFKSFLCLFRRGPAGRETWTTRRTMLGTEHVTNGARSTDPSFRFTL